MTAGARRPTAEADGAGRGAAAHAQMKEAVFNIYIFWR